MKYCCVRFVNTLEAELWLSLLHIIYTDKTAVIYVSSTMELVRIFRYSSLLICTEILEHN